MPTEHKQQKTKHVVLVICQVQGTLSHLPNQFTLSFSLHTSDPIQFLHDLVVIKLAVVFAHEAMTTLLHHLVHQAWLALQAHELPHSLHAGGLRWA